MGYGHDRIDKNLAAIKAQGFIPYVLVGRNLGHGRHRYEAYDPEGKLMTHAFVIAGPSSVAAKLNNRKGSYTGIITDLYTFEANEVFSMDALRAKALQADERIERELAELDRQFPMPHAKRY